MLFCVSLICKSGKENRKKQNEIEVDARASWGAAVLRPCMGWATDGFEVMA